jgi:hypothetical protein
LTLTMEAKTLLNLEMAFMAINYDYAEQTISYTVDPSDYQSTPKLRAVGMTADIYYAGTVGSGSTATSIIIESASGVEVETTDEIIVFVQTTVNDYVTRTPSNVSGAGIGSKTCTVTDVGAIPTAGDPVYIRHTECLGSVTLTHTNEISKDLCVHPDSGYGSQGITDRTTEISATARWRTILEMSKRDNVVGIELAYVAGDTPGNMMALFIPNFYYTEIPRSDADGKIDQEWTGIAAIGSGNDEFIIGFI